MAFVIEGQKYPRGCEGIQDLSEALIYINETGVFAV